MIFRELSDGLGVVHRNRYASGKYEYSKQKWYRFPFHPELRLVPVSQEDLQFLETGLRSPTNPTTPNSTTTYHLPTTRIIGFLGAQTRPALDLTCPEIKPTKLPKKKK